MPSLSDLFLIVTPCFALSIALYSFLSTAPRFREFNKMFAIVVVFQLLAMTLFSLMLLSDYLSSSYKVFSRVGESVYIVGVVLFVASWLYLCRVFYKVMGSLYFMRSKRFLKYIPPFSWLYDKFIHKKSYEIKRRERELAKNSPFDDNWIQEINETGGSILLFYNEKQCNCTEVITKYILSTLQNDETVDYISVLKHPLEIPSKLSKLVGDKKITEVARNLSVIDCFSKYCAFDDRVLTIKRQEYVEKGFTFYEVDSFASIHSATTSSWYRFRKQQKGQESSFRIPHRSVFNTLSELTRYSSEEQYLLFLKHVISSEKEYGMITLIIEPFSLKEDLKSELLQLADVVVSLDENGLSRVK